MAGWASLGSPRSRCWQVRLVLLLAAIAMAACGQQPPLTGPGRVGPAQATASPGPSSSPSVTPQATPSARIPIATQGGTEARLITYDPITDDILLYPGAGIGVLRPAEPFPGVFLFDDLRNLYFYDEVGETRTVLVDGDEVGGFAFDGGLVSSQNVYFRGTSDEAEALLGVGDVYRLLGLRAMQRFHLWPWLGKPRFLTLINALGRRHGGILSFRASPSERYYVFTTFDGGLFLYDAASDGVQQILPNLEVGGRAFEVRIDPIEERFVVWSQRDGGGLMLLDLRYGGILPLSVVNLALSNFLIVGPRFLDRTVIGFVAVSREDPWISRLMTYDFASSELRMLVVLNMGRALLPSALVEDPED